MASMSSAAWLVLGSSKTKLSMTRTWPSLTFWLSALRSASRRICFGISRGLRMISRPWRCSYLPRVRLAGRTLGLEPLGRLPDEHDGAFGAGDATFEHQQVALGVDADDLVGAGGRADVAHLARHAHT